MHSPTKETLGHAIFANPFSQTRRGSQSRCYDSACVHLVVSRIEHRKALERAIDQLMQRDHLFVSQQRIEGVLRRLPMALPIMALVPPGQSNCERVAASNRR